MMVPMRLALARLTAGSSASLGCHPSSRLAGRVLGRLALRLRDLRSLNALYVRSCRVLLVLRGCHRYLPVSCRAP